MTKNNTTNDNARLFELSFLLSKVVGQSLNMMKTFMPFISTYLIDNLLYLKEFEVFFRLYF